MTGKNRCYNRSRIAEKNFRQILRYFALDLSASDTARLTGISLRSINSIYIKLRERIAVECEKHSPWSGQIEIDESYFEPRRVRGKRGRGAGSKTNVFGLFKRNGWVATEIVPDAKKAPLRKAIRGKVALDSVIHSDGWRGYHGLVDMGYAKHLRVNHGSNEFANDQSHIYGPLLPKLGARRRKHQQPLLRQRPPAPNQPRRRHHQRHRARRTALGNPKTQGQLTRLYDYDPMERLKIQIATAHGQTTMLNPAPLFGATAITASIRQW